MDQRTLSAGGDDPYLPENWKAPQGYDGGPVEGALWVGPQAATDDDIAALETLDGTADPATLVGTLDSEWNAEQYADRLREALAPWDTFPCPGGRGSARYKFQKLPEGVLIAQPKWWVHKDGHAWRAAGGEPVTRVNTGHGAWKYQIVDIEVTYDSELDIWTVVE